MTIGKKISDLAAVSALTGTEVVEIEQSSSSKKGTTGLFAILALTNTFTGNLTVSRATPLLTVDITSGATGALVISSAGVAKGHFGINNTVDGLCTGPQYALCLRSASAGILFSPDAGTTTPVFINVAGTLGLTAGTTARAPLNMAHGAAPTSPVNGDIWTTSAGLFVRVNGVTVGPLS